MPKTPLAFRALNNINLSIGQGEYIGIIGQTGSGKTTFVEHLNGLLIPTSGEIEWSFINSRIIKIKDKNSKKKTKVSEDFQDNVILKNTWRKKFPQAKDIRKRLGIIFQFAEYQLFEETIEKDIIFGPKSFGISKKDAKLRAKKYLNLVGLDDSYLKKSPFDLSGGQKRRVALAGILAMEPDILVADEPTAGLDPVGVREILNIFKKLNQMGKTIIIVTHDLDNVLEETKRVIIFKDGTVVKDGDTYDILRDTKFLKENEMEPPKLLAFVSKLEERGMRVPKITSIEELANFLNRKRKETDNE
ncbi:ATPase component of general energizing module [Mycoplasmopsis meleagridis]|uniref:Energy-coupling factor transporter ATP-binding protein EcfA2 n=1 Tax=Mycoplasmopsis meleagridis ATCC 25294 TaxID=1264554 RepID=A0A0F5H0D8_9BACT|nr:ABC transporter [Mycoplasmopsis meleagridis ATCC 25294]OAD18459.1 ATPase component of general energizing module [Mycoplasmopsis meleagridis]